MILYHCRSNWAYKSFPRLMPIFLACCLFFLCYGLVPPAHATMPRPLEQCCLEMIQGIAAENNLNCPKPPPNRAQCEEIAAGWYAYGARAGQGQGQLQGRQSPPQPVTPKPLPTPPESSPIPAAEPAFSWSDHFRQHPQGTVLSVLPLLLALALIGFYRRTVSGGAKTLMLGLAVLVPPQFHLAWLEVQALPQGVVAGTREGLAMIFIWLLHGVWLGLLGMSVAGALGLCLAQKGVARVYGFLALAACLASGVLAWQTITARI